MEGPPNALAPNLRKDNSRQDNDGLISAPTVASIASNGPGPDAVLDVMRFPIDSAIRHLPASDRT